MVGGPREEWKLSPSRSHRPRATTYLKVLAKLLQFLQLTLALGLGDRGHRYLPLVHSLSFGFYKLSNLTSHVVSNDWSFHLVRLCK